MRKVFLCPGHNGLTDPGAVANGMREADINLDVAFKIGEMLSRDFHVNYSRTSNVAPPSRWGLANTWNADIYISIHCNAFTNDSANGTETFFFDSNNERSQQSRGLATDINTELVRSIGTHNRGIKADTLTQHSSGISVLRQTDMPAVLVELAFLTAAPRFKDVEALRNRRNDIANGIVNGIYKYFEMDREGLTMSQYEELKKEIEALKQIERERSRLNDQIPKQNVHFAQNAFDFCRANDIAIHEQRFDENITRGEAFVMFERVIRRVLRRVIVR